MPYTPKRPARIKQREALDKMQGRIAFALLMAMRTGKTKVILDDWSRLVDAGKVRDLLVIAPAGVYRTWETAIKDDVDDNLLAKTKCLTWISGEFDLDEIEQLRLHKGPRILLVNVEALSAVRMARELCLAFLAAGLNMVVIDESVIIKTPSTRRTKFVLNQIAPKATYRRILSGLPTPRSPLDLYCQFNFLDPRILPWSSYEHFRNHFAIVIKLPLRGRRFPVPIIKGYRNLTELQKRIDPHSIRVRLEDCYDLPPSTYIVREVPMTEEQKKIYAELKKFATAKLDNGAHVTATQVITQILRLHQVLLGHTRDEKNIEHLIPEKRIAELIDLLEDHDGKAVIWCSYDIDVRRVSEALAKHFKCKVARFWGGNLGEREAEEHLFKTNAGWPYMVATAAAGGKGRTWDIADLVVYFSNTDDLDHRMQSEERPKNVGKTRSIAYVDLVVRGTVDEKILQAMRKKINMTSVITGDTWKDWVV